MTISKRLFVGLVSFFLAFCLGLSFSYGQEREKPSGFGSQRPLAEILNPDGTLKLGVGVQGSFDPRGFQMVSGPGGVPTFVPIGSVPQAEGRGILAAAGDESWDGQFGILTPSGPVRAIAVSGTDVYVGGEFTLAAGVPANNIAKWNGTTWSALGPGTNSTVYVIAVSGTDVYAGGAFTTPFPYIAKYNGFWWQTVGGALSSSVYAIAVSGTNVYVGGYFQDAGGVTAADRIALWNGTTWSALGSGLNGGVQAIAVSGTDVYAGGYFLNAGGVAAADYIAKWNGTTWSALGSSVNGAVFALAASETDVYAGGDFNTAGGISASYIAKWSGTAWSALGSGLNYYPNVIAAKGRDVYVGGLITQAGGIWLNCIAKWNGTAWSALGSGVDNQVFAITASGRYVYVGGYFQNTGGKTSHHFGRWIEPLAVVSPNGGESWDAGSSHAITWSADASVGPVNIEYSLNNGSTWGTVVGSTANTGTYSWAVPNAPSASCRVRISEAADGDPVDTSDGTFTITGFQVTSPTSTDHWTVGTQRTITWSTVGSFPTVRLELSTDNGASWGTITASTANTGSYVWTVAGAISSQAIIRVSDSADGVPYDDSLLFSIYPVLVLTMTSPNGGESWEAGSSHAITWSAPSVGPVRIEYSTNNGSTWTIVAASTANTGSHSWTVPATPSASCGVRISEAYDGEPVDTSDGVFNIVGLRVTSPNGGESWGVGSSRAITWETLGSYPTVRIELSTDAGVTWETLTASTANTGSFPWTVPDVISGSCLIRVSEATDGVPSDKSDSYFSIYNPPNIWVISPNGGESWLAGTTHDITWGSSGVTGFVMISYSTDNGASYTYIALMTPNDGSYSWPVPSVLSTNCLVQVADRYGLTDDTSDAVFSIVGSQTIAVTAPNGGESWATGSTHDITWTQEGLSGSVTIDLNKGGVYQKTLGTANVTAGTFYWEIAADETPGTDYRVLIWLGAVSDESDGAFIIAAAAARKDDFVGTWDGQGVYYRNSDTGAWVKLASPATMVTVGDFDGDGTDDLIGLWPTQGGIWVKYSQSGAWAKLSSTAQYIAAGDMNGDGRVDLLGTWDGQGVYYRDSISGVWVKLASPATMITTGDLDGDGTDDLIGLWPAQGGIWVKYSQTGLWAKLSSTAVHISAGDMNGDGRDDLLGTWDGQGVYYRDSISGAWVRMASPATLITAGDIDGDATDDLIGIWPTQGGVWVKYSETATWELLSSTATDIAAGKMRPAGAPAPPEAGEMQAAAADGAATKAAVELPLPMGGDGDGPGVALNKRDISDRGPGGARFVYLEEKNLVPTEDRTAELARIPGPGEPGFICAEQENLFPQDTPKREKKGPSEKKIRKK